MEDEIKQILKENTQAIVSLDRTCNRLVCLVEGDPKAGVKGYGHRLEELEKYKNNDKRYRWIERTVFAGLLTYLGFNLK